MKQFDPLEHMIFEGIVGSRLYGTQNKDSDIDQRGICLPPLEVLIDPFQNFEVKDGFEGEDRAIYDLGKFMNLCAQANPNIVEFLFIPETHYLVMSDVWEKILGNKHLFLSKKVKRTFTGYSFAQIKAIERHRRWFISPPDHKPRREDFGLNEMPIVSEAHVQNVLSLPKELFNVFRTGSSRELLSRR